MAPRRWRAAVGPVLLLITGLCLGRSLSLTWAAADVPDGTRYKISPTTVSHVLKPDRPTSPTVDCGWPVVGRVSGCAIEPREAAARDRLRGAGIALLLAALGALAAGVLPPGRTRRRQLRLFAAALPGGLAILAIARFQSAAPGALSNLGAVNPDLGGMGWYLSHLAPALCAVAALLEWRREPVEAVRPSVAPAVVAAATLALLLLLAPRPVGNSLALVSSTGALAFGAGILVLDLARQLSRVRRAHAG